MRTPTSSINRAKRSSASPSRAAAKAEHSLVVLDVWHDMKPGRSCSWISVDSNTHHAVSATALELVPVFQLKYSGQFFFKTLSPPAHFLAGVWVERVS